MGAAGTCNTVHSTAQQQCQGAVECLLRCGRCAALHARGSCCCSVRAHGPNIALPPACSAGQWQFQGMFPSFIHTLKAYLVLITN